MFGTKKKEEIEYHTSDDFLERKRDQLTIFTDNPADDPTSDFDTYAETIADLVKYSEPQFTVGIYGDWGTGKTTLMKKIRQVLDWNKEEEGTNYKYDKDKKVITIWFNAWRYEREEHFATIALMRTIAYTLAKHDAFKPISKTILSGLKIIGMDVITKVATDHVMTDKGFDNLVNTISNKTEVLNGLDKETIYFEGLNTIKKQLEEIRQDEEYRVIVFIDDLDRCSPKRALEVLESVKVFLDIKGFVYIMGLSIKTVAKLISVDYSESGIKGEDYIKKIIQIPIRIPPWNTVDIESMILKMTQNFVRPYAEFLKNNAPLISIGVETNPRELKAFMNNLMVGIKVLSIQNPIEKQFREIVTLEILKSRWNEFYVKLVNDEEFRNDFSKIAEMNKTHPLQTIIHIKEDIEIMKGEKIEEKINGIEGRIEDNMKNFKNNGVDEIFVYTMTEYPKNLLEFLRKKVHLNDEVVAVRSILGQITDWELYRKVVVTGSAPTEKEILKESSVNERSKQTLDEMLNDESLPMGAITQDIWTTLKKEKNTGELTPRDVSEYIKKRENQTTDETIDYFRNKVYKKIRERKYKKSS